MSARRVVLEAGPVMCGAHPVTSRPAPGADGALEACVRRSVFPGVERVRRGRASFVVSAALTATDLPAGARLVVPPLAPVVRNRPLDGVAATARPLHVTQIRGDVTKSWPDVLHSGAALLALVTDPRAGAVLGRRCGPHTAVRADLALRLLQEAHAASLQSGSRGDLGLIPPPGDGDRVGSRPFRGVHRPTGPSPRCPARPHPSGEGGSIPSRPGPQPWWPRRRTRPVR
jgi:hypothetical protein